MTYKLGSLFDGSGGFPLSGVLCGIEPAWAAEVEPYPIAVTRSRFPKMEHLGDISKVNGADIEPVDIITFGSPCQDLSVAGKRAGLKHEANGDEETTRSGLFMEAVRIIKEMRAATNGEYPRFALWENVPGAFSSNKGEDFRIVCEELIKVIEPTAVMPSVPQKGWPYSDSYIGNGWSLAYRVFDAQYWGVPQRRRRIHLVVDFRGECAREVLFEREGVRGYFETGRTPWKVPASHVERSLGADDSQGEMGERGECGAGGRQLDAVAYTLKVRSGCDVDSAGKAAGKGALVQTEKAATLACVQDQYLFQPTAYSFDSLASNSMKSSNPHSGCREVDVAKTLDTTDPNPSKNQGGIAIVEPTAILDNIGGQAEYGKVTHVNATLRSAAQGAVAFGVGSQLFENHSQDTRYKGPLDVAQTVSATYGMGGNNQPFVVEPRTGFVDVEMEVAVRKYEVDCKLLCECLRDHKAASNYSNKDIADALNLPLTQVEHWFRLDQYFAIPEPDVWPRLKKLLGIETTEFDQSIMTLEFKGGTYDMRNRIHTGETSPTLTCGCGNDLHLVPREPAVFDGANVTSPVNASNPQPGDPCHTLSTDCRNLLVEPVFCLQGNGIDRADTAGCNGKGVAEDVCYTLNTIDRPAVAFGTDVGFFNTQENVSPTLLARQHKDPHLVSYPLELHDFIADHNADAPHQQDQLQAADGVARPLVAATHGAASHHTKTVIHYGTHYIVRRLTPTECARLQGFADQHGHLEKKADLTEEEYSFWMEVRNTHAAINGKAVKEYTKAQMLTWYNKLWTDGAEYKMWGNGIALPPALYCMQGIMDVLNREEDDAWLL